MKKEVTPDPDVWIRIIDGMLESDDYAFARDYLMNVRGEVDRRSRVTTKQTKAILNIRRSADG